MGHSFIFPFFFFFFHLLLLKGVVMIRADLYKGKLSNFIEAGRDGQPRKNDPGFILDRGNIGERI